MRCGLRSYLNEPFDSLHWSIINVVSFTEQPSVLVKENDVCVTLQPAGLHRTPFLEAFNWLEIEGHAGKSRIQFIINHSKYRIQ